MSGFTEIKIKLNEKLGELNARAHDIDDDLSELADDDWAENAVAAQSDEVLEGVGGMALGDIQKIKLALSKIEAGTYDTCARCQSKIPEKRLVALPYATTCIKCA